MQGGNAVVPRDTVFTSRPHRVRSGSRNGHGGRDVSCGRSGQSQGREEEKVTFYDTQAQARADAAACGLREKVLCFVTQPGELLVFDHVPAGDEGVQIVAGGVEPGELPAQTAVRELREESGLSLDGPQFLVSYLWEAQLPERFTRQVCHAYALSAPAYLPDTWHYTEANAAGGDTYLFRFRWADLHAPALDWEMDTALPHLHRLLDPFKESPT